MNTSPVRGLTIAGVLAAALSLAACGVVVREDDRGNEKRVDIRSPFGSVTVNTGAEPAETGLPIYPGARPLRNGDEPDHANVTVGNSWFGVTVAAAKFESDDQPEAILAFYRQHLQQYGDVTECHGQLNFRRRHGEDAPVCREGFRNKRRNNRFGSGDITLGVGTRDRHRMVAVKPRPGRTRFEVVFIDTHDRG